MGVGVGILVGVGVGVNVGVGLGVIVGVGVGVGTGVGVGVGVGFVIVIVLGLDVSTVVALPTTLLFAKYVGSHIPIKQVLDQASACHVDTVEYAPLLCKTRLNGLGVG